MNVIAQMIVCGKNLDMKKKDLFVIIVEDFIVKNILVDNGVSIVEEMTIKNIINFINNINYISIFSLFEKDYLVPCLFLFVFLLLVFHLHHDKFQKNILSHQF